MRMHPISQCFHTTWTSFAFTCQPYPFTSTNNIHRLPSIGSRPASIPGPPSPRHRRSKV